MKPSIVIASDHAGYHLKKEIFNFLWNNQHCDQLTDVGCYQAERCDYPDFAEQAVKNIPPNTFAILVCGTGQGMAMTANKFPGIRAGVCYNTFQSQMIREHNNANVLCLGNYLPGLETLTFVFLGARCTSVEDAEAIVETFLTTEFSKDERHQLRIDKMMAHLK